MVFGGGDHSPIVPAHIILHSLLTGPAQSVRSAIRDVHLRFYGHCLESLGWLYLLGAARRVDTVIHVPRVQWEGRSELEHQTIPDTKKLYQRCKNPQIHGPRSTSKILLTPPLANGGGVAGRRGGGGGGIKHETRVCSIAHFIV